MGKKLTSEDLQNESKFELLTEVSNQNLRQFVVEQITKEKTIIRIYSVYQVMAMMVFGYLFADGVVKFFNGNHELLVTISWSLLFSLSALIVIHELLHALAYLATGARKIFVGVILKKFIFYAMADRQVIAPRSFHIVALTPFVIVKLICLVGIFQFYDDQLMYFFLSVMCLHSLFCAGDIALLAFYKIHNGKEIYNFDNRSEGKTYFYARIK